MNKIAHIAVDNLKQAYGNFYFVDLFCGAGGVSSGVHLSGSKVIACVNHDKKAIESHKQNHPEAQHYNEDVRDENVIAKIHMDVSVARHQDPHAVIALWASLECTNFSNAKGGMPRDADSRSLADHMPAYIEALEPDIFLVENVREFLSWGPLDEKGKPISRTSGADFVRWYEQIKAMGYVAEYRILNSADYGAYQARKRLFIQFSKIGIRWPQQTHSKKPGQDLFSGALEKWKPVRDVLELEDRGTSIFTRKKPLVEKSLSRIYAGLEKFVKPDVFLIKNYSGDPSDKVSSIDRPSGTVTTKDNKSLCFLQSYYGNGGAHDVGKPCPTLTTKDRFAGVFINSYYGRDNAYSVDDPCPTVPTNNRHALCFLDQQFGTGTPRSIQQPATSITTVPKLNLVLSEFLVNPQHNSAGHSLDGPCCTLIARMDKSPLSLASVEVGALVQDRECDSPMTLKIKEFMRKHGIADIKIRMLKVGELKQIQGFSKDYVLLGTQAEQKKFIGNAVEVNQAKALIAAVTCLSEVTQ